MITPHKPTPSVSTSQASIARFRGDVFRRVGNLRSVALHSRTINDDQLFGLSKARQEAITAATALLAPVV